jgi:STE24 endopeptidase
MPLLLLICLTLACLPIDWPKPMFGLSARGSAIETGLVVAGLLLIARGISMSAVRGLARDPGAREEVGRAYGLRRFLFFFLNLAGLAAVLLVSGWGRTVNDALTFGERPMPGAEVAILTPYLIVLIGSWALFFDAERAFHAANPLAVARGPFWSRAGYVFFVLRHHALLVFLPVGLTIAQFGLLRQFPELVNQPWAKALLFVLVFLFILAMPSLVPIVLGLRKMPAGQLRSRLERAAKRLNVRYRNLYVWDTRRNLATAMVAGLIPQFRHIVFTDLLLDTLTEDEIEGVFGHEVGHVKHGHLLYYAVFLMLSFLTLGAAYHFVEQAISDAWLPKDLALALSVVTTGAYLFVVFGVVSRRCERQADVFGCKALSCAEPACGGHGPDTVLVPGGRGLCRTGVATFVHALERVEEMNGLARSEPKGPRGGLFARLSGLLRLVGVWLGTWQHSTIAKRVDFLRTLADDPVRERRFQRRVTAFRWGLLIVLGLGVVSLAWWGDWRAMLESI